MKNISCGSELPCQHYMKSKNSVFKICLWSHYVLNIATEVSEQTVDPGQTVPKEAYG